MGASWLHPASSIGPHYVAADLGPIAAYPVTYLKTRYSKPHNRSAPGTADNDRMRESRVIAARDAAEPIARSGRRQCPGDPTLFRPRKNTAGKKQLSDGVINITDDPVKVRQIIPWSGNRAKPFRTPVRNLIDLCECSRGGQRAKNLLQRAAT